jgi:hypothetical protein
MTIPKILLDNKKLISRLKPEQQAIPYIVHNWNKYFAEDTAFRTLSRFYQDQITRKNIFDMGNDLRLNYSWNDLRKFFISIMVWGFGTTGYGAYRTYEMVNDKRFKSTVENCYQHIMNGDIERAYNAFWLNKCRSAFYTKFFYFTGRGNVNSPIPLILDSVVARYIEEKCNLDIGVYANVNRHTKNPKAKTYKPEIAGKISSVNRNAAGYIKYLNDMTQWANHLRVTPDQIELFFFS